MAPNLNLLDTIKLADRLGTNFACGLSPDDRIFVICEASTYVLTLKPNLSSTLPQYSYQKLVIEPSSYALCDHVDIDVNSVIYDLPKDVLYEVMARAELSQNLQGAVPSVVGAIHAQWSDGNMVDNAFSMLGVLTNLYSLDIYIRRTSEANLTEFRIVSNLTKAVLDRKKSEFVYSNKMPPLQKIRELKKRVEYISPLTFTWGHTFHHNGSNCSVIFIGHFNGDISIWRIYSASSSDQELKKEFLSRYSSKLSNISTLYWHRTEEFGGVLCAGDVSGKISVLRLKNVEKPECFVEDEIEIYSETDHKVDKIVVMNIESLTILIAVKQCYLLLYAVDNSGKVFDFMVHNVGDYYITGITIEGGTIKLLTYTGRFKLLELSIQSKKIVIVEMEIPVKHDFVGYRTHGFIQSNNRVFYGILLNPYRLKNSIKGKKFVNFCFFNDTTVNPLKLLLDNKTGSLRTFWDTFETLRLLCLKEQRFPWLGLKSDLNLDSCSLNELKTLRLIAKISEAVFVTIKRVFSYEIKPYILLHYLVDIKLIVQRITCLLNDKVEGKELTLFQMQSIDLQVFFLKELVASGVLPKAQVGKTFIKEISHVLSRVNEMEFPDMIRCNFCGEKLIGATCLPPHSDSRCIFTMMPILLSPLYKCLLCHGLAHREIENYLQVVICPYCDYPMEKICLEENIQNNLKEVEREFQQNQTSSDCASDCIKDSSESLLDLCLNLEESNNCDGNVYVSDDSDNDVYNLDKQDVKVLYSKIMDMKLNSDLDCYTKSSILSDND